MSAVTTVAKAVGSDVPEIPVILAFAVPAMINPPIWEILKTPVALMGKL